MNKDIHKYITNYALCTKEKVRTQLYPLQMTEIFWQDSYRPGLRSQHFQMRKSTHTNNHWSLNGWSEALPVPNKKADTIVHVLINNYLPILLCPCFIWSDNGTEFKNQLMDHILQQLGIDHIFSFLCHPQSNRKLEVFHKYHKLTLKKLCENDPDNWNKYINQVLASYM